MKSYIPLHVHSHYSLQLGLSKPNQIAERCNKIGVKSCAITDSENISGTVQFYKSMKEANIKPILGCEINVHCASLNKTSGLVILAKNYAGWQNLIQIISESNTIENAKDKPQLDLESFKSLLNGNMIAFCGSQGTLLADIISSSPDSIDKTGTEFVSKMKDIFGEQNFFLESQLMDREHSKYQVELTEHVRRIGKLTNTKVVCSSNAHYASAEDSVDQRVLLCNQLRSTFPAINKKLLNGEPTGVDHFFKSDNFYLLSPEEMNSIHTEEEIENTNYVDSLCEEYNILAKPVLPKFDCPNNQSPDEYLRHLCREGWKARIEGKIDEAKKPIYVDRVKYELEVLQGADLSSYFLIVQDILSYIRSNGWLPGPGRGCFLPNTEVKMYDNTLKPIQDIKIGDYVVDAFGNQQQVYDTLEYDIDEDIIELELENGIVIKCTKDHKFLTKNRGWVEAQYLTEEDDIVEV